MFTQQGITVRRIFVYLSIAIIFNMTLGALMVAAQGKQFLFGSAHLEAPHYTAAIAQANVMNKYVPEASIKVVVSGATHDNLKRVKARDFDGAFATCYDGACMAYNGTLKWAGDPFPKQRILNFYDKYIAYIMVRADSGVSNVADLDGKPFNPAPPGTSMEYMIRTVFKELNINPKWYVAGTADALDAQRDGRIVGSPLAGAGIQCPAAFVDIMVNTPLRLVTWTDEQMKVALKAVPGILWMKVPAGAIKALPKMGAFNDVGFVIGNFVTTDVSEKIVYKWIKALNEHWNEVGAAYPASKLYDPVKGTIDDMVQSPSPVPLHAGVVKYFKEIKIDVPAKLIPKEYKGK